MPPGGPVHPPSTQSGWARASAESGLTISGSTHSPKSMPRWCTRSISGCSPSGIPLLVDEPVPQRAAVIRAPGEPAVVEHEPLHPDLGSRVGEPVQRGRVVVEVDRLPGVQHTGRGNRAPRDRIHGCSRADSPSMPHPSRPPRSTAWCIPRPAPGEPPRAPAARRSPGRGSPVRRRSAQIRLSPLHARCTAHTSPGPETETGVPAIIRYGSSWPGRPCRRLAAPHPVPQRRPLGPPLCAHSPLKSSTSAARSGTGSSDVESRSWKVPVPSKRRR